MCVNCIVCMKGPGPPEVDSPLESQPSDHGTTIHQHSHAFNNNHPAVYLNHNLSYNTNNNHFNSGHPDICKQKERIDLRNGSLSLERDYDSCSGKNCSGIGDEEVESPNEFCTETSDNDAFDWWFQRNRSSKKSR